MLMVVITTRYLLFFSCVFSQSIFLFVSRDVTLISRQILMTFFKKKERRFFRFFFQKKNKTNEGGKIRIDFPTDQKYSWGCDVAVTAGCFQTECSQTVAYLLSSPKISLLLTEKLFFFKKIDVIDRPSQIIDQTIQ